MGCAKISPQKRTILLYDKWILHDDEFIINRLEKCNGDPKKRVNVSCDELEIFMRELVPYIYATSGSFCVMRLFRKRPDACNAI